MISHKSVGSFYVCYSVCVFVYPLTHRVAYTCCKAGTVNSSHLDGKTDVKSVKYEATTRRQLAVTRC